MSETKKIAALLSISKYLDEAHKKPISDCPVVYKKAIDWARDAAMSVGAEKIVVDCEGCSPELSGYDVIIAIKANTIIRRSNMHTAISQHQDNTTIIANGDIVAEIYSAAEYERCRGNLFAGSDFSFNFDDCYILNNASDVLRVNDLMRTAIINRHMSCGVIFTDLSGVAIGRDAEIAAGTVILPGTVIIGNSVVGSYCEIGPGSFINNTTVGDGVTLNHVVANDSVVGSNSRIGPYAQLRTGSVIGSGAKIGNFVEVKNSNIGDGTSVAHLTYIGDADVGKFCNFGCGTVVVNYDGEKKSRSQIDDYCFIGCNTNLVSPVHVGEGAFTAAGSTITKDVPPDSLAIERGELHFIEGYSKRKLHNYFVKHNRTEK